ncbi:transposase [Pseudanabaenaceae cyanobacterium LEGE 13415]|nr:transposase [Pseudanabaenaceae cyanobacterium LEGE 13415]
MQLTFKYKLKPHKPQCKIIDQTIELCRRQYNFRLGERFDWYDSTRTPINACPLNVSILPVDVIYQNIPEFRVQTRDGRKLDGNGVPITKKGDIHPNIVEGYVDWLTTQLADLKQTKQIFPEYKEIHSQVLQDVVNRVEYAFSRFTKPDKNGKTSGRPRFKGKHYYNSITYTQLTNAHIVKDERGRICLDLAKIGLVPMVFHRSIPNGFKVKTGTIIREADGYYVSLVIEDKRIPDQVEAEILPTEENTKGIDLGLYHYAFCSDGTEYDVPKFLRKSASKLAKLQQRLDKKKSDKTAKSYRILRNKIAKLHQHIARQRLDWQFKLAYKLFEDCDVIAVEDLKLKNLIRRNRAKIDQDGKFTENGQSAKSGLNKSFLDAAFGQFVNVLKFVAWKLGKRVIEVNPSETSQHCWNCLNRVSKTLNDRWHDCDNCGESLNRDENSAKLIKRLAIVGMDVTSLKKAITKAEAIVIEEASVLCVA